MTAATGVDDVTAVEDNVLVVVLFAGLSYIYIYIYVTDKIT